jgi:hypothetical protein
MDNIQKDHDLMIELRTEMRAVRDDIKELKDGTLSRLRSLEQEKADRKEIEVLQGKVSKEMEARLRKVEAATAKYFITLSLYGAAAVTMIGLIIYHILQQ